MKTLPQNPMCYWWSQTLSSVVHLGSEGNSDAIVPLSWPLWRLIILTQLLTRNLQNSGEIKRERCPALLDFLNTGTWGEATVFFCLFVLYIVFMKNPLEVSGTLITFHHLRNHWRMACWCVDNHCTVTLGF